MPLFIPINLRSAVEGYRDANKDNWTDLFNYEKIQNDRLKNYEYGNTVDYSINNARNNSSILANKALVDQAALAGNVDIANANNLIAAAGLTGTQRAYDNGLIADNTTRGYRVIGSQQNANIANNNLSAFNDGRDLTVNRLNYDTDLATGQNNAGIRNNNSQVNLIQSGVNAQVAGEYRPQLLATGKNNVSAANLNSQQQQTAALQTLGMTNAQYEAFRQSREGYQNALNEQANANIAMSGAQSKGKVAVANATSQPDYLTQYAQSMASGNIIGANTNGGVDIFSWGQPTNTTVVPQTANSGDQTNQSSQPTNAAGTGVVSKPTIDLNVIGAVLGANRNSDEFKDLATTTGRILPTDNGRPTILNGAGIPDAIANNNLTVGGTYNVSGPVYDPETGAVDETYPHSIFVFTNQDGTMGYRVIK